jgi:hypothetical protein
VLQASSHSFLCLAFARVVGFLPGFGFGSGSGSDPGWGSASALGSGFGSGCRVGFLLSLGFGLASSGLVLLAGGGSNIGRPGLLGRWVLRD